MNLQFYIEKLHNSKEFKKFIKENPKTYFCSGFFAMDSESKEKQQHLDFYIPDKKEKFSFNLGKQIEKTKLEILDEKIPLKLNFNFDFKFEEIEKMIKDEMEKQGIKNKLQKILISLQNINEKETLICTAFVSMLGLLKIQIEIQNNSPKIISFEKKSFFDVIKRIK